VPYILSVETLTSTAAATLALELRRSRPRLSSSLITFGLGYGLEGDDVSFAADFERDSLSTGLGSTMVTFLVVFERAGIEAFLDFVGDFDTDFLTEAIGLTGVLATTVLTTLALATDALATEAFATEAFATEAFATEAFAI